MTIKKILIACRGEIALRINRCCREMGIKTVGVYTTADKTQMHLKFCDETVCIGPVNGYLSSKNIVSAALTCQADAIHPGYGFLAENAKFAELAEENDIIFIGPKSDVIQKMGDKLAAKRIMQDYGGPCVPGTDRVCDEDSIIKAADDIGYPIMIKAAAGGGGRGMRVVHNNNELISEIRTTQREAEAHFGDNCVYLERYLGDPRHVEVQVLADNHGNVQCLGTRDCSIQRRHQKLIEEAPAANIPQDTLDFLCQKCIHACQQIGYTQAGTLEFLYQDNEFYFIEMNTRIQVEHPVTEMVSGIDIVKTQIDIANGQKIQSGIQPTHGHAIELRICAENPETFMPSVGTITDLHVPAGLNIRFDSHLYTGYTMPIHYDSLIGKLIVYSDNRDHCIQKLQSALDELVIEGIQSNTNLFKKILKNPEFSKIPTIHFINNNTQGDNHEPHNKTTQTAKSES